MSLRLAEGLILPTAAVTETFGILAARGAGKSNTAAVLAEEDVQRPSSRSSWSTLFGSGSDSALC